MQKTVKKKVKVTTSSHPASRLVRTLFEHREAKMVAGAHVAAFAIIASIFEPQTSLNIANRALAQAPQTTFPTTVSEVPVKTETSIAWPVKNASVSQRYQFGHWGIDITSENKDIYPIDKGKVIDVVFSKWFAYGNHLIIEHPNNRKSLYAHLESISVKKGDEVTRETAIGIMGQTGWATGVHLHLEIYQDGKAVNPLEILPV